MQISTHIEGLDSFKKDMEALAQNILAKASHSIDKYMEQTGSDSYDEAPVETGFMRNSQQIKGNIKNGNEIESIIGYETRSGANPNGYAILQHEDIPQPPAPYNHPRGGNKKFLESPARRNFPAMVTDLKNQIETHPYSPVDLSLGDVRPGSRTVGFSYQDERSVNYDELAVKEGR